MTIRVLTTVRIVLCLNAAFFSVVRGDEIDFNRDVRSILSDKCFHCHGPDASNQDSAFRLDSEENAFANLGGYTAIVAGKPDESELVLRIESDDPDTTMPPTDAARQLSETEKRTLRRWVTEGAKYDQHWAFSPPIKREVPEDLHPIDHFVRKRLPGTGLTTSKRAGRRQLIRRVTLDLTGLPPKPKDVEAFVVDDSPDAYEKVVDRLLSSSAYGERMAQVWLDAGRYADSAGYQNDFKRSQWPWRDWVIDAYNANMPFDQFSIEQLAGDLLPGADDNTRLATAFSRNHRINNEGGIIPAEFLVEYVADRVETTSTVWLGLTTGCARCHDHKYDPISMKDYYSLFAFFHNVSEKGKDGATAPAPNMNVFTGGTKDQYETLVADLSNLQEEQSRYEQVHRKAFDTWADTRRQELPPGPTADSIAAHYPFDFPEGKTFPNLAQPKNPARIQGRENYVKSEPVGRFGAGVTFRDAGHVRLGKPFGRNGFDAASPASWSFFVKPTKTGFGSVLSCQSTNDQKIGYQIALKGTESSPQLGVWFELVADDANEKRLVVKSPPVLKKNGESFAHVSVTYDGTLKADGVSIYIDGNLQPVEIVTDDLPREGFFAKQDLLLGSGLNFCVVDEVYVHSSCLTKEHVQQLSTRDSVDVLLTTSEHASNAARRRVIDAYVERKYFAEHDPQHQLLSQRIEAQRKRLTQFEKTSITQVSIMREMPEPRPTHVLIRGDYKQPDTSEVLTPSTFVNLPPMDGNLPKNRLGLAKWLFQADNPLTARVAVNRYWQMLFGVGLVSTPEDFGSQGAMPSHPDLLDWLAVEFRETGWNVKGILKLMVMSETYCQDSRSSSERNEIDPTNKWLARGARFRLSAFAIRDQALAASGLLNPAQGGPPVMPYQPSGLWEEVSAKGFKYVVDQDEGLYRRSLYTFWRRTVPPPSMMNFDSAGREACTVNVSRTNTPLQAMNLQNDPQFVEAARVLGERMIIEGGKDSEQRITRCSQLLLGRAPSPTEMQIYKSSYEHYLAAFRDNPEGSKALVSVGQSTPDPNLDIAELAACTTIASVLLNLDETVTKE